MKQLSPRKRESAFDTLFFCVFLRDLPFSPLIRDSENSLSLPPSLSLSLSQRMTVAFERPRCLIVSESGDCIITGGEEGFVIVREAITLAVRFQLETSQSQGVMSLALSFDGNHLLVGITNGRLDVHTNVDRTSKLMSAMFTPEFNAAWRADFIFILLIHWKFIILGVCFSFFVCISP